MASQFEEREQVALAKLLDGHGLIWAHPPNGGNRSRVTGAKLKAQGVKAGLPDVLIFGPADRLNAGCHGLAVELKRAPLPSGRRLGVVSQAQRQWLANLEACGWRTCVAHGFGEAERWLRAQGVLRG